MTKLPTYVAAWRASAADLSALLAEFAPADWPLPTDCPGWTVQDVVAHCVDLETLLATGGDELTRPDASGTTSAGPSKAFTEAGVQARRTASPEQLRDDFATAVATRGERLGDGTGLDPAAGPGAGLGGGWTWETLLRNRVIDLWVHEQDIRRAVGRPGGLDTAGAEVTQRAFASALPFVVAKRVGAPAGSTAVLDVTGPVSTVVAVGVGPDGRGARLDQPPPEPTVRITMSTEVFTMLAAGRRDPTSLLVSVTGDPDLGRRIVAAMALTD